MARRIGENVQRSLLGGRASNHISDDLEKVRQFGGNQIPTLQRAVVLDVISDPGLLTDEELDAIASTVDNADIVDVMPINSIIARIVSQAGGTSPLNNTILFPFFSSHIMLPITPGETVYVIYEAYQETNGPQGFWFTRIASQRTIEDVNYTHFDRRYDPSINPGNYSTEERAKIEANGGKDVPAPSFPNGGNTKQTLTLNFDQDTAQKIEPYEQIKKNSKAYPLTTQESVPRWKKRPQDFVIQGKNNTLISLGEDRTGQVSNPNDAKGKAGTVDCVVGRSRKAPLKETEGNSAPERTDPRIAKNTRGDLETDKSPHRKGFSKKDNPKEGDPDFENDASRIYVSMQTEGDKNFNLKLNPEDSLSLPAVDGKTGTFNKAHIVEKSDHIRLIARRDSEFGIKGTVLLVREGDPDEDLGYFFIDENGLIQIESKKIYLGKSTGEIEPYIRWTKFQATVQKLQDQIDLLRDQLTKLASETVHVAFSNARGNLGAPIPSLLAALAPLQAVPKNLKPLDALKEQTSTSVLDSRSTKIFGT